MYMLDSDKVKKWWQENKDPDEDDVNVRIFKEYVVNLEKDPKVKKNFYLNFLKKFAINI